MRLTTHQLEEIERLTKRGLSLNHIAKTLGVSKTTVYYHFRKTRGMTTKKPNIRFESDYKFGEVIGIFAGDGSFHFEPKGYHYQVRVHFGIKSMNYLKYVKFLFDKSFGKEFPIYKGGSKRYVLQAYSKDIAQFFLSVMNFEPSNKSNTVYLRRPFLSNSEFTRGFLRGLLDTDGTICNTKTGTAIAFYTSSEKLAKQISFCLRKFEIKHGISSPRTRNLFHVYILKADNNRLIKTLMPFEGW